MITVKTAFNYDPMDALEKIDYDEPSVTVPDEAFTIEQLIQRHRAGLLTDVKTPIFTNDDTYTDEDASLDDMDYEKFGRLDPVDQQAIFSQTGETKPNRALQSDEEYDEPSKQVRKKKPRTEALLESISEGIDKLRKPKAEQ